MGCFSILTEDNTRFSHTVYVVFGSFHEIMQLCGARRLFVRLSVCKLLREMLLVPQKWLYRHWSCTMVRTWACIQGVLKVKVKIKGHVIRTLGIWWKSLIVASGWLDRDETCTRWSPDGHASRLSWWWSRSKVSWYGQFCDFTKIASSRRQMTRSWPHLNTMVPRRASRICWRSRSRSKVTWYGHFRVHCVWKITTLMLHTIDSTHINRFRKLSFQYATSMCLVLQNVGGSE